MTDQEILVDVSPGETRTAILSNGRLDRILIERLGQPRLLDAVVLAPVKAARRDLGAVFLDLGAYDGYLDKFRGPPPNQGEALIVQVTAEAYRAKAARVSVDPTLRGELVDLTPTRPGHAVARTITAKTQRARLRDALARVVPDTIGALVHATARECDPETLEMDAQALLDRWSRIEAAAKGPDARQGFRILEAAPDALARARWIAPNAMIHRGRDGKLFRERDIDGQIAQALERRMALPGGGAVVIDETEALVAVDIDGRGDRAAQDDPKSFAIHVATEIARQVRLRQLAGLILIDFPRIGGNTAKRALTTTLEQSFARDVEETTLHGWTRGGLLEITRTRREPSLLEIMGDFDRPTSLSATSQALEALRRVRRETSGIARPRLICPNPVKLALQGPLRGALDEVESHLGVALRFDIRDGASEIEITGD